MSYNEPILTDSQLMAVPEDEVKRLANTLSHRDYTICKIDAIRQALNAMMDSYDYIELEELGLTYLMNYRRKAIEWLESNLKEM